MPDSDLPDTLPLDQLQELARRLEETPVQFHPSHHQDRSLASVQRDLFLKWVEAYQPWEYRRTPSPQPQPSAPTLVTQPSDWAVPSNPYWAGPRRWDYPSHSYPQRFQPRYPGSAVVPSADHLQALQNLGLIPSPTPEPRTVRRLLRQYREGVAREWAVIRVAMSAVTSRQRTQRSFSLPAVGPTSMDQYRG
jgi:hypothetical protein